MALLAVGLSLAWIIALSHIVVPFALGAETSGPGARSVGDENPRRNANPAAERDETGEEPEFPGKRQIHALAEAYPARIEEIEVREDQWAARIGDTWYYYAQGRMLPRELIDQYAGYTTIRLYEYRTGPPRLPEVDEERAERLRNRSRLRATDPPVRHNGFLDALYGVHSAAEAERRMVRIRFLGLSTRVHPKLVEPLERVEAEVRELMRQNSEVRRFVDSLGTASGYVWREIAGTASRSYHSYGIAIDLIPRSYEGRFGYWQWAEQAGVENWWELPFERRWHVPQPMVDAFERQEFIWGGKWLSFDPIHFEYRPELFILGGHRDS